MATGVPALLLLAFSSALHAALAHVVVTGNPYVPPPTDVCQSDPAASCSRALFIDPSSVIAAPAPLQADTFSHVQRVRYLDSVVPV
jgi:hypothetical protein